MWKRSFIVWQWHFKEKKEYFCWPCMHKIYSVSLSSFPLPPILKSGIMILSKLSFSFLCRPIVKVSWDIWISHQAVVRSYSAFGVNKGSRNCQRDALKGWGQVASDREGFPFSLWTIKPLCVFFREGIYVLFHPYSAPDLLWVAVCSRLTHI